MNQVVLKGNLTRDPEVRDASGSRVGNFGIAVSNYYTNKKGEIVENTDFFECEGWQYVAEKIEKLKKGDPVLISGSLRQDTWEKEDQKFSKVKVRVNTLERLARFTKQDSSEPELVEVGAGDDIDF